MRMSKFEQFSGRKEAFAETESPEARFNRIAEEAEAAGGARFEQQTKDGLGDHWVEDAEKKRLYEIKFALKDPNNPEKGTSYYYDKRFKYNERGHLVQEEGQDFSDDKKGNAWKADFERSDRGEVTNELGEIQAGPDKGHKWQKQFNKSVLEDGTDVFQEDGEILEQGQNPKKEPKGHAWQQVWETKEGSTTHGGRISGGPEQGRAWGSWEKLKSVS